jgi:hypothetical protein
MITYYIGSNRDYLAKLACTHSPDAKLLSSNNLDKVVDGGVYYTSLADFDGQILIFNKALALADTLIYCRDSNWEDSSLEKKWTESSLCYFANKKIVNGIEHLASVNDVALDLVDSRKTESQQIWNAGCSITCGDGVLEDERYGSLIAKQTGLPISYLARSGSSIEWAADQILRSDIKENDIVIWGLTSINRLPHFDTKKITHVNPSIYYKNPQFIDIVNPDLLDSATRIYKAVTSVFQVINFCQKVNCQLVLAGILINEDDVKNFLKIKNYIHLYGYYGYIKHNKVPLPFIDIGSDGKHPGKQMHQYYAENIINKLSESNVWKLKI